MKIFPAIDLVGGKAVRLYKGDYDKMTVYAENPVFVMRDFIACGAKFAHVVDLEGARDGGTPNFETIKKLVDEGIFVEVGGGVRNLTVVDKYISAGVKRVILGTSAVKDENFVKSAVKNFGDKIAVGVDIKDGFVAIKGWTEKSNFTALDFCKKMQDIGVKTIISTDISRDGAMKGSNHELYKDLIKNLSVNIIASGGVSSIEDIIALKKLNLYGAIVGKAYYTGAVNLKDALEVANAD